MLTFPGMGQIKNIVLLEAKYGLDKLTCHVPAVTTEYLKLISDKYPD